MVKNGWRRQNLMGAHHFSPDGAKLTQAGELKVRWIMTQTPPAYRRMFVERDFQQEVTQQRIETVREFSNQIAMGQTVPEVLETHIVSEGRPAKDVADVSQNYRENMRPVALPTTPLSQGSE
jgi:hypothetical protein